jgi:3-hydroxyacyl-CoA dehydrogenase
MSDTVSIHRDGDVAVVTMNNPPVNALGHAVRSSLADAIATLAADAEVAAIVLAGAGRMFSAGADITEFGKPRRQPTLIDVINIVEASPKPVVAAIHGAALGGGLELTLACHERVAAPGTRLGLPEVKLGLIPGAGGTQRLPRVVGPEAALRIITSGEPMSAEDALSAGLVAAVAGDPVAEAIEEAQRLLGAEIVPIRAREEKLAATRADRTAFDALAKDLTRRARGSEAVAACIKAVGWSLDLPVAEGLELELATFLELVAGEQSKAQRHIFFAERQAAKIDGIPAETKARPVEKVAVIGAGTMGGGIAMSFVNAGIPVILVETSKEALDRGLSTITRNYAASAKRGRLTATEIDHRLNLIEPTTEMERVAEADLIIEAVFEEMDVKKQVFSALDGFAKAGAILATNTSYLNVDEIAAATGRPEDVVGTHFFSPANVMRLLEIVRAKKTAPDVLATAVEVGRRIGKVPVVVGVCHGFVGNRMLSARSWEGEQLLLEGALPQDVDKALTDFGFPMGPFAMGDLAGLDVGWRMRKANNLKAAIADQLCEMGRFGQKTGRGFYLYKKQSRTPMPDPEVEALIQETSKSLGIERRDIDSQEIIERLLYPLVSEGAKILDEGVAQRPSDIDVVWVYGYGFPAWRGGPMYWADSVGLATIRDRLQHYAKKNPKLEPAPLLSRLADGGRGFASLEEQKAAA